MKKPGTFYSHCAIAVLLAVLSGCATTLMRFDVETPAQVLTFADAPPIKDERTRFREIFCQTIDEDPEARQRQIYCEDYLWRLEDEKNGPETPRLLPAHDTRLRILLVTGAFSECFPKIGGPYQKPAVRLRHMGYQIDTIVVGGRSSSSHNAGSIAEAVHEIELRDDERLVLIGYSKGATDILHFLDEHPEEAKKVSAVLSVAGAINGTPVADKFAKTYARWFKKFPLKECDPGDGGVLESLKRTVQFPWLADHPLPESIKYFSLATFAHRNKIQPGLLMTFDLLKEIDPRNDGQLIFYDQVIPGSTLLGYANLDHWDIAIPVREIMASASLTEKLPEPYVRERLFEAMILFLAEFLSP